MEVGHLGWLICVTHSLWLQAGNSIVVCFAYKTVHVKRMSAGNIIGKKMFNR